MSSKKESDFDAMDFWQKHNRNVQLKRNADAAKRSADAAEEVARAKKEQALQAKLDREANDLHRAKMEEFARAEKEANDLHRAKMEELAKQEREAKEFSKQQQLKLYDVSCQIDDLEKQNTAIERIRLFYEINAEFERIVHAAIEDLQYRKLYTQTKAALKKEETIISRDFSKELSLYLKIEELEQLRMDLFGAKQNIRSFDELHLSKRLLTERQKASKEMPDWSLNTDEIFSLQKSIDRFYISVANLKWFWEFFSNSGFLESISMFQSMLFLFYKLDETIIQSKEWQDISIVGPTEDEFEAFCRFCVELIQKNYDYADTVLQIMENIDSPEAEETIEKIKDLQRKKLLEVLKHKQEEEQEEQKKEKVLKNEIQKKINEKHTESNICGCLGVLLLITGFCLLPVNVIISVICIFLGVGGVAASHDASKQLKQLKDDAKKQEK